jgi:hypothetical protein
MRIGKGLIFWRGARSAVLKLLALGAVVLVVQPGAHGRTITFFEDIFGNLFVNDPMGITPRNNMLLGDDSVPRSVSIGFNINAEGPPAVGANPSIILSEPGDVNAQSDRLDITNCLDVMGDRTCTFTWQSDPVGVRVPRPLSIPFVTEAAMNNVGQANLGFSPVGSVTQPVTVLLISDIEPTLDAPEPFSILLLATGFTGILAYRWRRKKGKCLTG